MDTLHCLAYFTSLAVRKWQGSGRRSLLDAARSSSTSVYEPPSSEPSIDRFSRDSSALSSQGQLELALDAPATPQRHPAPPATPARTPGRTPRPAPATLEDTEYRLDWEDDVPEHEPRPWILPGRP